MADITDRVGRALGGDKSTCLAPGIELHFYNVKLDGTGVTFDTGLRRILYCVATKVLYTASTKAISEGADWTASPTNTATVDGRYGGITLSAGTNTVNNEILILVFGY